MEIRFSLSPNGIRPSTESVWDCPYQPIFSRIKLNITGLICSFCRESTFLSPLLAMWPLLESAPLDVAQWHSVVKDEAGVKEQLCLPWSSLCTSRQSCLSTVQSVLTWKLSQGHCKIKRLALQPLHILELWDSLLSSPLFSLIAIGFTEYFFHAFRGGKKAHCECCWVLRCLSDSGGHPAPESGH